MLSQFLTQQFLLDNEILISIMTSRIPLSTNFLLLGPPLLIPLPPPKRYRVVDGSGLEFQNLLNIGHSDDNHRCKINWYAANTTFQDKEMVWALSSRWSTSFVNCRCPHYPDQGALLRLLLASPGWDNHQLFNIITMINHHQLSSYLSLPVNFSRNLSSQGDKKFNVFSPHFAF